MTQTELNHEVAQATGESIPTIAALGFVPLTLIPFEREHTLDWDSLDEERVALFGDRW